MNKHVDFTVDYSKLNILNEFNTDELKYPLLLSIPHAGSVFPEEFLQNILHNTDILRKNEDIWVKDLLEPAITEGGVTAISLNISRSFIDVNRAKVEIDPNMFYNYPKDDIGLNQQRSRYGLGIIHKVTADSLPIYDGLLSYKEAEQRIKKVYELYHKRMQEIISKITQKFGFCLVLDCHSMPSKICSIISESPRIDFCLGNLFEQSCPNKISFLVENEFAKREYYVSKNRPYSGAFITFNYCNPRKKSYTLQLEINRVIYSNEETFEKNQDFQRISHDISQVVVNLANYLLQTNLE
ncbi:MAG: N-formylglutamate amidohydrolase [Alphaproteobacteria bacterium]|nr:N-formylglutamate amidohydrolase [Alphaproteobacteria bacterium]